MGSKVLFSEKVLRHLCFITGISAQVAKASMFEGLDTFGQEADDPKGYAPGLEDGLGTLWTKDGAVRRTRQDME